MLKYPISEKYHYFASNVRGPINQNAYNAVENYIKESTSLGVLKLPEHFGFVDQTRKNLAKYLNVTKDEITFTKCTADGINIIAQGLNLSEKDEIIVTNQEFPANVYPWLNSPAKVKIIPLKNGILNIESLSKEISKKTKLIATSSTFFSTGFKTDLDQLITLCKSRGILLLIDGVQTLGYTAIDCSQIDFLVGDSRKYFGALDGLGFLYINKKHIDKVQPRFVGTFSVEDHDQYLDYDLSLKQTALKFELSGSKPTASIIALNETLKILNTITFDYSLQERFYEELKKLKLNYYLFEENQSHLFVIKNKLNLSQEKLKEKNILAGIRGNKIYIALHLCNTHNDIEQLLRVIY